MIFDLSKTAAVNGDAASAASSSSSQRRRRAPSSSRKRPAVHRRLVVVVVVVAPVALLLSVLSLRSMRRMMTTSDATRGYASSLVAELATNLPPGFHAEPKLPSSSSSSSSSSSPACRPHFRLALPGGGWTDKTKFKRLYFYHVRKAGVREREFDGSFPPPSISFAFAPRDRKRSCRQESSFFLAFSSVQIITKQSQHTHTHARAPPPFDIITIVYSSLTGYEPEEVLREGGIAPRAAIRGA